MRRTFTGLKIDENLESKGVSRFVIFGQMSDGSSCYHELDEQGNEIEDAWYSRSTKYNMNLFFLEGV